MTDASFITTIFEALPGVGLVIASFFMMCVGLSFLFFCFSPYLHSEFLFLASPNGDETHVETVKRTRLSSTMFSVVAGFIALGLGLFVSNYGSQMILTALADA